MKGCNLTISHKLQRPPVDGEHIPGDRLVAKYKMDRKDNLFMWNIKQQDKKWDSMVRKSKSTHSLLIIYTTWLSTRYASVATNTTDIIFLNSSWHLVGVCMRYHCQLSSELQLSLHVNICCCFESSLKFYCLCWTQSSLGDSAKWASLFLISRGGGEAVHL